MAEEFGGGLASGSVRLNALGFSAAYTVRGADIFFIFYFNDPLFLVGRSPFLDFEPLAFCQGIHRLLANGRPFEGLGMVCNRKSSFLIFCNDLMDDEFCAVSFDFKVSRSRGLIPHKVSASIFWACC